MRATNLYGTGDVRVEDVPDSVIKQPTDAHGGFWDGIPDEGAQAEAIRVPFADGTLVKLPVAADSALTVAGGVTERTRVRTASRPTAPSPITVSAKRLGAEQIVLMGRHQVRTELGKEFGATDVVSARGEEGVEQVRELTGGDGTHVVLECVGNLPAYEQPSGSCARAASSAASASRGTRRRRSASAACSATTSAWPAGRRRFAPTSRS